MTTDMTIESLLPFIKEIDRLKTIDRQALIHSGGRRENSAEHSWHLALSVMVFEKTSEVKLDVAKAIKMALLHDVVEIDAGDMMVYGDLSEKNEKELKALERIMALLPKEIETEFKKIWMEFEAGESAEAKFVAALDRFLPIYSNVLNEGYSWKKHNITKAKVIAKCQAPIEDGLPKLWTTTASLLEKCETSGAFVSPKN